MDHTRHYLVAEMIHNALVPLRRSNGFAVIEWNKMGQQAKDEAARDVLEVLNDTGSVDTNTEEGAITLGIISTMYYGERMKQREPVDEKEDTPRAPLSATPQPTEPEKSSTPIEGNVIK